MEVVSCKINGYFFCTWFEDGKFVVEDVEARKVIQLSESRVYWTVKQLADLLNGSSVCFFSRETRDNLGAMRISKFKNTSGWNLRCVVWLAIGGRLFVHIPEGKAQQGWEEFAKMLKSSINRFGSEKIARKGKPHDVIPPPIKHQRSYAETLSIGLCLENSPIMAAPKQGKLAAKFEQLNYSVPAPV